MTMVRDDRSHLIGVPTANVAQVALRFEEERISYAELDQRSIVAAHSLKAMGVTPGRAFAVVSENRPEIMIAYYAAAKLGAVFISINSGLKAEEISYILDHSESVVLLHDDATAELVASSVPADRRRLLSDLNVADGEGPLPASVQNGDFMIAYTSGTTGVPKAVAFDQKTEVAANRALIELWGVTPSDRIVVALPLGFLYGLSTVSAMGLEAGSEIILLRRFHPRLVLDALVANKATVFHGVPTMFAMMLDYCESNDVTIDLSFMRLLVCAGAPLAPSLKARFAARFGKAIEDYYALTEIRPVFGRYAGDPTPLPEGAIGKAAPGAEIKIVDQDGAAVPDGVSGEILVRAAGTMLRYHKNPELTEQSFRNGLFATGDVGFRDARGFYHLTGRIKDIIIRGGANISPAEVENVLLRHDTVRAAAVVGRQDDKFGEVPVAFLVRSTDSEFDEQAILAHCKSHLADFKVPVALIGIPEMPLGATGKIDKNKLKERLERGG